MVQFNITFCVGYAPQKLLIVNWYVDSPLMLKKYFGNMRSAFLHGKAFKMIEKGNFLSGAKLLESLCEDESRAERGYVYKGSDTELGRQHIRVQVSGVSYYYLLIPEC